MKRSPSYAPYLGDRSPFKMQSSLPVSINLCSPIPAPLSPLPVTPKRVTGSSRVYQRQYQFQDLVGPQPDFHLADMMELILDTSPMVTTPEFPRTPGRDETLSLYYEPEEIVPETPPQPSLSSITPKVDKTTVCLRTARGQNRLPSNKEPSRRSHRQKRRIRVRNPDGKWVQMKRERAVALGWLPPSTQ